MPLLVLVEPAREDGLGVERDLRLQPGQVGEDDVQLVDVRAPELSNITRNYYLSLRLLSVEALDDKFDVFDCLHPPPGETVPLGSEES